MYKIKKVAAFSILLISLFFFSLFATTSLLAAPGNNPIYATIEKVQEMIYMAVEEVNLTINSLSGRVGLNETAIQQHETEITLLQGQVSGFDNKVEDLEDQIASLSSRLAVLEATPTPTPSPIPVPSPFMLVTSKIAPAITDFNPPNEYKSVTFKVESTSSVVGWAPAVSFDGGNTYLEQVRISCGGTVCPEVTVPLLHTDYYRFQTGSSSGLVSVEATYNDEPNSLVLTLGGFVNYPFTSASFNTDGFSTITITASGGYNPQHVTGISLQRNESGGFVQKEFAACDGGAICPIVTFPVLGGDYRVVLQGSGSGAVLGAILRK